MPKNCGMVDAELAARGRMRRGTRESRKPPKIKANRRFFLFVADSRSV
jgi:hypothetical protein